MPPGSLPAHAASADRSVLNGGGVEQERLDLDRERAKQDYSFRERELALHNRALELKEADQRESKWRNPLIVAVMAAAVAIAGNAIITYIQNRETDKLAQEKIGADFKLAQAKAQSDLILEAIKTGDPEKARANLRFFIQAGLIEDPRGKIQQWISSKDLPSPSLPSPSTNIRSLGLPSRHVSGTVLDAETQRPIAQVLVSLRLALEPSPFGAGGFGGGGFGGLPPGTYTGLKAEVLTDKTGRFAEEVPWFSNVDLSVTASRKGYKTLVYRAHIRGWAN